MPTKLALVIPGFQSSADDWCIPVFTNLARELSRRLELHVFALRYPARRDRYDIGAVHVHALGSGLISSKRIPAVSLLKLWRDFFSEIESEHGSSPFSAIMAIWATESGWLATRAARRLRLPSLVHLAGGELTYIPQIRYGNYRRGLAGRLVKGALSGADVLSTPSIPIRRTLEKLSGVRRGSVVAWAPGVDTAMFAVPDHERSASKTFNFVTTGSLIPVKGHDLLIRALALVRNESSQFDVKLRIVGDGPRQPMLSMLVRDLQLEGYVTFEGEVPHERLPEVYRTSDAFLLGSWHEAQCMAALEAMSCGLPWVAPPVGSLFDVNSYMAEEPSGVIFKDRDPASVADAMQRMIQASPDERMFFGRRARQTIEEHYALGSQANKLVALLAGLTDHK